MFTNPVQSKTPEAVEVYRMLALVQGFGPFGCLAVNQSELIVGDLAGRQDPDHRHRSLPVSLAR